MGPVRVRGHDQVWRVNHYTQKQCSFSHAHGVACARALQYSTPLWENVLVRTTILIQVLIHSNNRLCRLTRTLRFGSIAIFCACLALSLSCEIVIFRYS
eukprot:7245796-Prymnesium_polylepis.1